MKKTQAEAIVKSVVAGTAPKYAFADISSTKPLRAFGIDSGGAAKIEKRLFRALSGKNEPKIHGLEIKITPASTIAGIAAKLPQAYKEPLPAGRASKAGVKLPGVRKDDVEIAVRTALAQHSPKYSIFQIEPGMKLHDLGLNKEDVAKAQATISRTLVGPKSGIKTKDFVRGIRGKEIRTVGRLVDESLTSLSVLTPGAVPAKGKTAPKRAAARRRFSFRSAPPSPFGGGLVGGSTKYLRARLAGVPSLAGGSTTHARCGVRLKKP